MVKSGLEGVTKIITIKSGLERDIKIRQSGLLWLRLARKNL